MSVATREPVPPSLDDELAQLADEIRQHHKSVERHARAMLFEAIVAGEKLLSVKERLRHGEFGRFVAYSGVPWRSANDYVKLAANSQRCEVLEADSIRAALRALAKPRKPKKKEPNFGPPGVVGAWEQSWKEAMIAQGRDPQEVEGRYEWWDAKKEEAPPAPACAPGHLGSRVGAVAHMSKKGAHPRRGNKRGYGRRRWRNKNWPAEGQPAPVVRSQGTPKPTWWLTFWKRSSRCTGCGNTTAPEEVVAYCHPGGWVLCQGCAEREGVWKLASLSRRLKAKERGGPPKGT